MSHEVPRRRVSRAVLVLLAASVLAVLGLGFFGAEIRTKGGELQLALRLPWVEGSLSEEDVEAALRRIVVILEGEATMKRLPVVEEEDVAGLEAEAGVERRVVRHLVEAVEGTALLVAQAGRVG